MLGLALLRIRYSIFVLGQIQLNLNISDPIYNEHPPIFSWKLRPHIIEERKRRLI
jgi:hypothetical protein